MASRVKKGFIIREDTMSGPIKGVAVADDKDMAYGKLARGLNGKIEVVKSGLLNRFSINKVFALVRKSESSNTLFFGLILNIDYSFYF